MITEPTAFQAQESLRKLLSDEAAATRKYIEYKKKTAEWETYRNGIRRAITDATGNAPIVKIGDEVVLTYAPKDQFAGARFAAEYPALAEEFMRIHAVQELDVEALRNKHPDIADKFTSRTFVNKAA